MWQVICKEKVVVGFTLDEAMKYAKNMNEYVCITDGTTEIVGMFGVDTVDNKVLPSGESYDWTMRRDETHRSSRKKLV